MPARFKPTPGAVIMLVCFGLFEIILLALVAYLATSLFNPIEVTNAAGTRIYLNVFQTIPMMLVIGWVGFMIGYYAWCTYFYNFNFGRSDAFWRKFVERAAEEAQKPNGLSESDLYKELGAPRENPYKDETFGFPPGTVRGSLALTIVIGGLALLVASFGGDNFFAFASAEVIGNYFDFFRDAFLMVVAFYFGTKGLDIIQKERTKREEALRDVQGKMAEAGVTAVAPPIPPVPVPAAPATPARTIPATPTPIPTPTTPPVQPAPVEAMPEERQKESDKQVIAEFPHVQDLEEATREGDAKKVTLEARDFADFARDHDLEEAIVKAVCQVESSGSGFLKDGRPKILFEGHVFWKQLKKYGVDPNAFANQPRYRTVLYPKWTRQHYKGGAAEYDRLALAKEIHEDAALCSASWGLFQIMGYHFERLGYDSVKTFVRLHEESARQHLEGFGRYMDAYNLDDFLRRKEWAKFAERYNGPGYKQNRYDEKLEKAYQNFKQQELAAIERDLNQPTPLVSNPEPSHASDT